MNKHAGGVHRCVNRARFHGGKTRAQKAWPACKKPGAKKFGGIEVRRCDRSGGFKVPLMRARVGPRSISWKIRVV